MRPEHHERRSGLAPEQAAPDERHSVSRGLQPQLCIGRPGHAMKRVDRPCRRPRRETHDADDPLGGNQARHHDLMMCPRRRDRGREHRGGQLRLAGRRRRGTCGGRRQSARPRVLGGRGLRGPVRAPAANPREHHDPDEERQRPREPGHLARTLPEGVHSCAKQLPERGARKARRAGRRAEVARTVPQQLASAIRRHALRELAAIATQSAIHVVSSDA